MPEPVAQVPLEQITTRPPVGLASWTSYNPSLTASIRAFDIPDGLVVNVIPKFDRVGPDLEVVHLGDNGFQFLEGAWSGPTVARSPDGLDRAPRNFLFPIRHAASIVIHHGGVRHPVSVEQLTAFPEDRGLILDGEFGSTDRSVVRSRDQFSPDTADWSLIALNRMDADFGVQLADGGGMFIVIRPRFPSSGHDLEVVHVEGSSFEVRMRPRENRAAATMADGALRIFRFPIELSAVRLKIDGRELLSTVEQTRVSELDVLPNAEYFGARTLSLVRSRPIVEV